MLRLFVTRVSRSGPRQEVGAGDNVPGRHFRWKKGAADGLSRMHLKSRERGTFRLAPGRHSPMSGPCSRCAAHTWSRFGHPWFITTVASFLYSLLPPYKTRRSHMQQHTVANVRRGPTAFATNRVIEGSPYCSESYSVNPCSKIFTNVLFLKLRECQLECDTARTWHVYLPY